MRRIVRRQVTTIEIVSVEFTWAEENEPDEPALQKTILETPPRLTRTKASRRKRKTRPQTRKRSKEVGASPLNSTSE